MGVCKWKNDASSASAINNAGLIVGPAIEDWSTRSWEQLTSQSRINGEIVGTGHAGRVMGGPLAALAWLVEALAARGRVLKAGEWVSTGMTTGIHAVRVGDVATFEFVGGIRFSARAEKAGPA